MKYILKYLLVVFCLLFFSNQTYAQSQYKSEEELIKNANKFFDAEDYISALPLFSQLLSTHQSDASYNYKFGVCLLYGDRRDVKKPIKYLEQSVPKLPEIPEVHYYLGLAYHQNYRFTEAIDQYKLFKSKTGGKKFDIDRQIEVCQNGITLLSSIKDLYVLEKKEVNAKDYFRSYNDQGFSGKFLTKPDEFKSKVDKRKLGNDILFLSDTSKIMFYSSYGESSSGSKDIYMSRKQSDNSWGVSQTLGVPVNTSYDEDYPFLLADGKTLYFCSKGNNSMGGYDVFRSVYDSVVGNWGIPVNMDFAINTPFDDILFATNVNQEYAMFSSNRSSVDGLITTYKVRIDVRPKETFDIKMVPLAGNMNDPEYKKSIDFLATKDELAVNSNPTMFEDQESEIFTPARTEVAVVDKQTPETPSEPDTADISNAQILQEFFNQKKDIEDEANGVKQKYLEVSELAAFKLREADKKQNEANAIELKAKTIINPNEQQYQLSLANRLKSDASQIRKEHEVANKQATLLNAQYEKKKVEANQAAVLAEHARKAIESGADVDTLLASMNKLSESPDITEAPAEPVLTQAEIEAPLPEEPLITEAPKETTPTIETPEVKEPEPVVVAAIPTKVITPEPQQPENPQPAIAEAKQKVNTIKQTAKQNTELAAESEKIANEKEAIAIKKQVEKENIAEEIKALPEGPEKSTKTGDLVKLDKEIKQAQLESVVAKDVAQKYIAKSAELNETASTYETQIAKVEQGELKAQDLTQLKEPETTVQPVETAIATAKQTAITNRQKEAEQATVSANTKQQEINRLTTEQEQVAAQVATSTNETEKKELEIKLNTIIEEINTQQAQQKQNTIIAENLNEESDLLNNKIEAPKTKEEVVVQKKVEQLVAEQAVNLKKYDNNKSKIEKIRSMDLGYDEESYAVLDKKSVIWDEEAQHYFKSAESLRQQATATEDVKQKQILLEKAVYIENQALESQKQIFIAYKTNDTTRLPKPESVEKIISKDRVYDTVATNQNKTNKKMEKMLTKEHSNLVDKEYKKQYNFAMDLVNSQKYDQATQILKDLLKRDTNNANINFHLGFCVINTSLVKTKAQSFFEKAANNTSIDYSNSYLQIKAPIYTYYYLGLVYQYQGQYQKALDSYKKFKSFINDRNISEFEDILGDLNWQIQLCERALQQPGEDLAENQKKDTKIEDRIEKKSTVTVGPDNKEKLFKEAMGYFGIGEYENAASLYLALLAKDKYNANLSYFVGACYLNLFNDKTKADPYIRFAIANIAPEYKNSASQLNAPAKAHYCMGTVLQYEDSCVKSVDSYDKYLATLNPKKDAEVIRDVNWQKELCSNQLRLAKEKIERERRDSLLLAELERQTTEVAETPKPVVVEEPKPAESVTQPEVVTPPVEMVAVVEPQKEQPAQPIAPIETTKPVIIEQPKTIEQPKVITQPKVVAQPNVIEPKPIVIPPVVVAKPVVVEPKPIIKPEPVVAKQLEVAANTNPEPVVAPEDIKTIKYNTIKLPEVFKDVFIADANKPAERVSAYNNNNPIPIDVKLPAGLVYKVQIGSFKKPIEQDAFAGVRPIVGETTTLAGYTRYIAGIFAQKQDASKALGMIKNLGYNDAFLVVYYNGKRITQAQADQIMGGAPQVAAAQEGNIPQAMATNEVFFTIQVGYLGGQDNASRFNRLEPLYKEVLPTGFLRYATGVFMSADKAIQVTNIVRKAGWADAFTTAYYGGKRITVAEARQLLASRQAITNPSYASDVTILPEGVVINTTPATVNTTENNTQKVQNDIRDHAGLIYTVQVASGKNMLGADKLKGLSPLYYEPLQSGMYRHLYGIYNSAADAQRVRNTVVAKGIADAFISSYYNGNRISIADAKKINTQGAQVNTAVAAGKVVYKMQLGIFNSKAPEEKISVFKQNANTDLSYYINEQGQYVYTSGSYADFDSAQQAQTNLRNQGIAEAEVVAFKGAVKITLEKAKELLGK